MDKQKLIEKLKKSGYKVTTDSSVVIVLTDDHKLGIYGKIKKIIDESGYDASWGVRYDASAHPAVVSENAQGSYEADFDPNEQSVTENEKTAEWQDNDDTDAYGQMSLMDLL